MQRLRFLFVAAGAVLVLGCGGPSSTPTPVQMIPPVECVGVPAQTCQEIVADARRNARPGTFLVHVRAVCTRAVCTLQDGDVTIDSQYSDGHTESMGMGWSGAIDVAPPPPDVPGGDSPAPSG
jgi:hypothetical protein